MRKPELSIALIQVLRRAAWQARALGHSYVGTEHFLLSLLTAERAGGVLRSLCWEECTLRSVLLLERGRGSRAVPLVQAYSPLARSAIGAAAHEAAALRAADVRPEREGSQVRSCWNYIVRTWSKRRRQWSRSSGANASLGSCCKF